MLRLITVYLFLCLFFYLVMYYAFLSALFLFICFINKGVEVEECYHKNLAYHADEEDEIGVSCCRAKGGKCEHKETGEEEVGSLLLDPSDDTNNHKGNNCTEGENATDCICPSRSCIRASVAYDVANNSCFEVSCKTFSKAKDTDNCCEHPNRLNCLAFKLKTVTADGEHKGNKHAVADEANTANRFGESAGYYCSEDDEHRIKEKTDVNKEHTESHKASVLLKLESEEDCQHCFQCYDAPNHCGAVVNDKITH